MSVSVSKLDSFCRQWGMTQTEEMCQITASPREQPVSMTHSGVW